MNTLSHRARIASVLVIGGILAMAGLGGTAQAGAAPTASDDSVTIVKATLSDSMQITLDRYSVPAGQVRFLVTNAGHSTHELVVLKTDLAADQLVANPDEPGKVEEQVHMGETGDIDGTRFNGLQLELGPGSYVIICNEPGHYMAGMRVAFTVYQPTVNVSLDDHMAITLDRSTVYAGRVLFAVTNRLGDIAPAGARDQGLYWRDTRFLSHYALSMAGGLYAHRPTRQTFFSPCRAFSAFSAFS